VDDVTKLMFRSAGRRERVNSPNVLCYSLPIRRKKVSLMELLSKSATAFVLVGLLIFPTSAVANNPQQNLSIEKTEVPATFKVPRNDSATRIVKVLSDHPGAATALTPKQKSEIRQILTKGKGNQNFRCTGISLAGQSQSMYRVVLLRAQLVCRYAKSVEPSIKTTVKERLITARKLNGRVEVISN
jgi:hypothetical protein